MDVSKSLTSNDNFFEDFAVGQIMRHARGKTITQLDNVLITNLVLNTAQGHFNDHVMSTTPIGQSISYGGVNFSMVLGLACQDCCENALEELGLDNIRLSRPVIHGDTIYAASEVLAVEDANRGDAGIVTFRHYGYNQRDELIATIDRRALILRRPS
jgi:itaconyl-CoA hydratase